MKSVIFLFGRGARGSPSGWSKAKERDLDDRINGRAPSRGEEG